MHRSDKATLRLAIGLGLAALIAYGLQLAAPYVVCVMAVLLLVKPGPPLPLAKGIIVALLLAALLAAGVVMVPLLEHYALTALALTAVILFGLFFAGLVGGNPLTMVLVMSFTLMPVAGVFEQSLVGMLSVTLAVGVAIGTLVGVVSGVFFPEPTAVAVGRAPSPARGRGRAGWIALRATLIVMPVFVLALSNPAAWLPAIMKTVAIAQQVGETDARSAGRELVGSTLVGAVLASALWLGLLMWPSLWMLALWLCLAALWTGSAMSGARRSRFQPSFWSNALITALILLGPAIEDSASGKSVLEGSAMRLCLFIGVACYAWVTIWCLELWRGARASTAELQPVNGERVTW